MAVTAFSLIALTTAGAQAEAQTSETRAPRHPISEGKPIREVVPPKPAAQQPQQQPSASNPVAPTEPVERSTRQPTRPERIQPNPPPEPSKPIESKRQEIRKAEPPAPIGTIDPRPGTIKTHPGTIETR
ncbi:MULTISPECIES: hypothetical protein [Thalassobaculum]|nr:MULTISPECIES: hypothetical protein [Thalassobaculum]